MNFTMSRLWSWRRQSTLQGQLLKPLEFVSLGALQESSQNEQRVVSVVCRLDLYLGLYPDLVLVFWPGPLVPLLPP